MDRKQVEQQLRRETEYFSLHTKRQYFNQVSDYLDFVGQNRDWRDPDVLYNYTQKLKKQNKTQATVNYIVRGPIGALFRSEGRRIPIKLPRVMPAVYNPDSSLFWSEEEIAAIVKAARQSDKATRAIMAVATIYAPRASEILRLSKKDIMPAKKVIIIHTVKYNLTRTHVIAPAIYPVLLGYDYPPITEASLRKVLDSVLAKAKIERKKRQSFHAFRHTLFAELRFAEFTLEQIYKFTGWLPPGTLGAYVPPLVYDPENDAKIFKKHPFLKYWE
jgi:integrase